MLINTTRIMKTRILLSESFSLKLLFVLPLIILIVAAVSSCTAGRKAVRANTEVAPPPPPPQAPLPPRLDPSMRPGEIEETQTYTVVEEMPQFPGGDQAILKYIAENTRYPKEAKEKGIQGRVIVRMIIDENGMVSDAVVLRGVNLLLDAEAIRVVNSLPPFTPGKQGGVNVPVYYMIPITFALSNNAPKMPVQFEVIGNDTLYSVAEVSPQITGEYGTLKKFKDKNVNYPDDLKNLGIEGFVIANFIVEKDGSVTDIKIERGASPSLDAEALRVLKLLPKMLPAKVNGKPVKYRYTTAFNFLVNPVTAPDYKEGEPFVVVEEMPMFPGGDSCLLAYLSQNTKYPETAKINMIEGRVIIRFCVTKTGGTDRISVLRGVDPELDAEAIRVVSTLPAFKPGKQGGKPVDVWYMVPISFALDKNSMNLKSNSSEKSLPITPQNEPEQYDEAPVFTGGEIEMYKFINSNIKYPVSAKEKKVEGKVILNICVNTSGVVDEVTVLKGVDPELDAEAVRVVKMLPQWKPGKLEGKPVKVRYPLTVSYKLK